MDFGDLFSDCYQQSLKQGRGFLAVLTQSMTSASVHGDEAWKASLHVPEPTCLGDFLKLVGDPLRSAELLRGHFTSPVVVSLPYHQLGYASSMRVIEENLRKFHLIWYEAHMGGEFVEYGSWVETGPRSLSLLETIQRQRKETNILDKEVQ